MNEAEYFKIIEEYKLLAKHEVGQNFLIDPDASKAIVSLLETQKGDRVLEIGPGAGSLSFFLSSSLASCDLVDIDEGLVTKLKGDFSSNENIYPFVGNALKWDLSPYTKVIGNLPYYITSSLIERILIDTPNLQRAVLMIQKEAFSRITAKKGTADYGPLSISLSYRMAIKREFTVGRTSFSPMPHVDSTVFSLTVKEGVSASLTKSLYKVATAMFLHRRKTILNNLSAYLGDALEAKDVLSSLGIDPKRRPEELSVDEYVHLTEKLLSKK